MKIFKTVLMAATFISLSAWATHENGKAHEGDSNQMEGERKNDFFPKKPADKSLSTRPEQVELLEPKALSQVTGNQVTLKWKPSQGAESYRLQVATDPNFKWLVTQQDFYKDTSFTVTGLQPGGHYFWRVYGLKPSNEANYTASFGSWSSFTVK